MVWSEANVLIALAEKHYKYGDYFITRCKSGPSWYNKEMVQFDGVAIRKSWSKPSITVYEVKCSRNDFIGDEKWPNYLGYCHKFMFACPTGLIKKEDIDTSLGVGLIWVKEKDGIYTTRTIIKPKYRVIDISADFLMYIIMNKLDMDRLPFYSNDAKYIREWLANKKDNMSLAYRFKSRLIQHLYELTKELDSIHGKENDRLEILETLESEYGVKDKWGLNILGEKIKFVERMLEKKEDLDQLVKFFYSIKRFLKQGW